MAWTLLGLLRAAGVDAEISGDAEVTGLAYDSRNVGAGDLFCCIPGLVTDGHDHADQAVARGATALLVERTLRTPVPQARVDAVRTVLGPLSDAFYGRPSETLAVAAVTGTNGKTTVTYLLESIARAAGRTPGVVGTVSRRFAGIEEPAPRSTPEAIDVQSLLRRMLDAGVDLVALEATSDGLAQGRLRGTRFVTAGFTNLTQDHLDTHKTMDAYFEAKALLFDRAYTQRAVINLDDPYGRLLSERARGQLDVQTYGTDADVRCENVKLTSDGSRATIHTPSGSFDMRTHLVGRYNISNCMCATGIALHCDIDLSAIAAGIEGLRDVPGRLERVDAGQPFLVVVDYAHTPDALESVLRTCRELASGSVICVFGCGGDRDRTKRPLMGEISTRWADLSLVTSDNPRSEDPARIIADIEVGAERGGGRYRTFVDRRQAIAAALVDAKTGDVVLIAGKGHEQGQQFADRAIPFDDRLVARELLARVRGFPDGASVRGFPDEEGVPCPS